MVVEGEVADQTHDAFLLLPPAQRGPSCLHPPEQLACPNLGAAVHRYRLRIFGHAFLPELAAVAYHFISVFRGYLQFTHVAETGECFPPEAEGLDGLQIGELADLGGGEAFAEEREVCPSDALAVVAHLDVLEPSVYHSHADLGGLCVNCVLDKFLDDWIGGGVPL